MVGQGQPEAGAGEIHRPEGSRAGLSARPGAVRAGPLRRRRSGIPRAGPPGEHRRLAGVVRAQHVHPPARGRTRGVRTRLRHPARAAFPRRSGAGWRAIRHRHRVVLRAALHRHRRIGICRRDQEIDLYCDELDSAGAWRAADALQRQPWRGRRCGAVLRPVGDRQDDAVVRSASQADRRRRAWLGRWRRVQFRGRLLRQGDRPVGRARTGNLGCLSPFRHRSGERGGRPARQAGPDRQVADREHPLLLSRRVHPQRGTVRPWAGSRAT